MLVAALAGLLLCPLWLGPMVRTAANAAVPEFTGTPFSAGDIYINPYTGHFSFKRIRLANPSGYPVPDAFTVETVDIDLDTASLGSDTIHIREIAVEAPYASYVKDGTGTNNFDRIIANAKAKAKAEGIEKPKSESKSPGKKVIIDRLTVSGTRVKVSILPEMPIPTITLRDIGRESNGATLAEVGEAILSAAQGLMTSLGGSVTSALGTVGAGVTNAIGTAGTMLKDTGGELKEKAESVIGAATTNLIGETTNLIGGTTNLLEGTGKIGDVGKTVGGAAVDIGKAVGTGAMDAGKAVGAGAMDAGKAVGKGAMDAGKAIGTGTKDALKKVGNLFGN